MRHRIDHINTSIGHRMSVRPEIVDGITRYTGFLDGRCCVSKPTQEAAINALLRRFADKTVPSSAAD